MQVIIRDHYEQLCDKKLNNLEEKDTFQETFNFPRLNYEKIKNLGKRIMTEFCKIFKEELIPILLKLFQKLLKKGKSLLPHFMRAGLL
jgi:hypothetical protein